MSKNDIIYRSLGQIVGNQDRKPLEEILDEYDGLTHDDIRACLLFATKFLEDTAFMPLAVEAA